MGLDETIQDDAYHADRFIKSKKDIEGMRVSCKFNAELMHYIKPLVRVGMSTNDIDKLVHDYTVKAGHIPACKGYRGFPKSLCTSLNNVVCHGIPSDKDILKEGDIINIDLTSIVGGYHGDLSETLYIGKAISDGARKVTETSREALRRGIAAVRPGNTLYDVGDAIQTYVEAQGCSVVREYTGHGIGKVFHEDPQVPHFRVDANRKIVLKPGMIFTIEPMVNLGDWRTKVLSDKWTAVTEDGSLSAQFEHTILVTESGVEVMTASSG
jgi:methionyl aminopeptidase